MTQLYLPLGDLYYTAAEIRRVDWLTCLTGGLPLGWDRSHPAYVRFGLGPILNVPRHTLYSLRAINRWG